MEKSKEYKEYINAFNSATVNMLCKILEKGIVKGVGQLKIFHLVQSQYQSDAENPNLFVVNTKEINTQDELLSCKEELLKNVQEDMYLGYYWAIFTYSGDIYKIAMFFRGLDRLTGNIHVLPGPIQMWKQENNSEKSHVKNNKYYKMSDQEKNLVYTNHRGSMPYCEEKWTPLVKMTSYLTNIPMLWDIDNMENIAEELWNANLVTAQSLDTLKIENREPKSVKKFYSMNDRFKNWYNLLYPNEKVGRYVNSAYHLLRFVTEKIKNDKNEIVKGKLISAYQLVEVGNEGYFNIIDGQEHVLDYDDKLMNSNENMKKYMAFWAGPNYVTNDGWNFVYKKATN